MRAVKSVLVMAGALKRENPEIVEDVTLIRALRDSNLPKFLSQDAILFKAILSDLFPGVEIPEHDYGIFLKTIQECTEKRNLQGTVRQIIGFFCSLFENLNFINSYKNLHIEPKKSSRLNLLKSFNCTKLWLFDMVSCWSDQPAEEKPHVTEFSLIP